MALIETAFTFSRLWFQRHLLVQPYIKRWPDDAASYGMGNRRTHSDKVRRTMDNRQGAAVTVTSSTDGRWVEVQRLPSAANCWVETASRSETSALRGRQKLTRHSENAIFWHAR